MNSKELNDKLGELRVEEFVWIIYIGIIILSFYSNNLERRYFINNDNKSKEEYRKILIIIFVILTVVYFYFLKDSYEGIIDLKPWDDRQKIDLAHLSFIASLLIFISGCIFLYIAVNDQNLNVEIAFN